MTTCTQCHRIDPDCGFYKDQYMCKECFEIARGKVYHGHARHVAPPGQKWCAGCGDFRPLVAFARRGGSRNDPAKVGSYQARCKACRRKAEGK